MCGIDKHRVMSIVKHKEERGTMKGHRVKLIAQFKKEYLEVARPVLPTYSEDNLSEVEILFFFSGIFFIQLLMLVKVSISKDSPKTQWASYEVMVASQTTHQKIAIKDAGTVGNWGSIQECKETKAMEQGVHSINQSQKGVQRRGQATHILLRRRREPSVQRAI